MDSGFKVPRLQSIKSDEYVGKFSEVIHSGDMI